MNRTTTLIRNRAVVDVLAARYLPHWLALLAALDRLALLGEHHDRPRPSYADRARRRAAIRVGKPRPRGPWESQESGIHPPGTSFVSNAGRFTSDLPAKSFSSSSAKSSPAPECSAIARIQCSYARPSGAAFPLPDEVCGLTKLVFAVRFSHAPAPFAIRCPGTAGP